jgi:hypothetical protein
MYAIKQGLGKGINQCWEIVRNYTKPSPGIKVVFKVDNQGFFFFQICDISGLAIIYKRI